ncbi:MAG: hypothetical protein ABI895_23370 [Deltaproteobacteria bacterium]
MVLLLALGCGSETKLGQNTEPNQASTAIQALTAKDEQVVTQCGQAVQRCEQQLPDATPSAVCQKLAEHCAGLQQHLDEARAHAVGCLKGVQACQEHAPEQAQCSRDVASCQPLADGATEDRETVIQCSDKVQACLLRVASLPAAAAVSCENMAAACDRVSALVKQAGQQRAEADPSAADHAKKAHDAMDAGDDDADDAAEAQDDEGADDADEVDEADEEGDQGGRADAGAARAHRAGAPQNAD